MNQSLSLPKLVRNPLTRSQLTSKRIASLATPCPARHFTAVVKNRHGQILTGLVYFQKHTRATEPSREREEKYPRKTNRKLAHESDQIQGQTDQTIRTQRDKGVFHARPVMKNKDSKFWGKKKKRWYTRRE